MEFPNPWDVPDNELRNANAEAFHLCYAYHVQAAANYYFDICDIDMCILMTERVNDILDRIRRKIPFGAE